MTTAQKPRGLESYIVSNVAAHRAAFLLQAPLLRLVNWLSAPCGWSDYNDAVMWFGFDAMQEKRVSRQMSFSGVHGFRQKIPPTHSAAAKRSLRVASYVFFYPSFQLSWVPVTISLFRPQR